MKKLLTLPFLISIILISCDTNCEDCGPIHINDYKIFNQTKKDIKLYFFRDSNKIDEISVKKQSNELLYEISQEGAYGPLINEPYNYDSLHYINENNEIMNRFYRMTECDLPSKNPLCEENHTIIKNETDKKGNTFIHRVFIIE